jgi:F0F1-type ATP synthase assembly protein I
VNEHPDDRHPIAIAAEWGSQITAIGAEIILPAVAGWWLDRWLGTSYWTVIGALAGPILGGFGFWRLLRSIGVLGGGKAKPSKRDGKYREP